MGVQFEVVLAPEELLAHLALEPAPAAMGRQVTPQVTFTRKHLEEKDGFRSASPDPLGAHRPVETPPFLPPGDQDPGSHQPSRP